MQVRRSPCSSPPTCGRPSATPRRTSRRCARRWRQLRADLERADAPDLVARAAWLGRGWWARCGAGSPGTGWRSSASPSPRTCRAAASGGPCWRRCTPPRRPRCATAGWSPGRAARTTSGSTPRPATGWSADHRRRRRRPGPDAPRTPSDLIGATRGAPCGRCPPRCRPARTGTRNCRCPVLDSPSMSPATRTPTPAAPRRAGRPVDRPPAAAARRPLAGLPGLLRVAGGELPHRHRADHQRGLRLHRDADQPAARRAAHAHRGGLRRLPQDVPLGALHRVQGQPDDHAGRLPRPGRPDQGGAHRAGHPVLRGGQLRGRRHHRHAGHPGRGRRLPGAHHQRRPGLRSSWSATT